MMTDVLAATLVAIGAPDLDENLYPDLARTAAARIQEFEQIPADRKKALEKLALWVRTQLDTEQTPRLVFICTHNSRRSHISQIWAQTAARVYGLPEVRTYSGGTEATAFNPRAVAAMKRAGFVIEKERDADNPHYAVSMGPEAESMEAFSKVYHQPPNPQSGFAAVMTCSQADQNCPMVQGAAFRVPVPYDDPKAADGTARESETYDARVAQIGREMFYLFSRVRP